MLTRFACCRDEHDGQLEFDVGHLTVWDPSPINAVAFTGPNGEEALMDSARAMTQSLVNKLFALPSEPIKGGRQAQLPEPTTKLPRQKPLPKPKPLTKWQQVGDCFNAYVLLLAVCAAQVSLYSSFITAWLAKKWPLSEGGIAGEQWWASL